MEEDEPSVADAQPTWWTRLWRWAFDRPLRHVVIGIGAILLLLTAPFGGWATVRTEAPTIATIAPGEEFTAGPLRVTLERAVWNTDPSTALSASQVGGYLLLVGTIRSTDDEMVSGDVMQNFVRLTGLTNLVKSPIDQPTRDENGVITKDVPTVPARDATYYVLAIDDESLVSTVGYGLTYRVVIAFQAKGDAPPTSVTVDTFDWTWRQSRIDQQMLWLDRTRAGQVTLPVTVSTVHAHPDDAS